MYIYDHMWGKHINIWYTHMHFHFSWRWRHTQPPERVQSSFLSVFKMQPRALQANKHCWIGQVPTKCYTVEGHIRHCIVSGNSLVRVQRRFLEKNRLVHISFFQNLENCWNSGLFCLFCWLQNKRRSSYSRRIPNRVHQRLYKCCWRKTRMPVVAHLYVLQVCIDHKQKWAPRKFMI